MVLAVKDNFYKNISCFFFVFVFCFFCLFVFFTLKHHLESLYKNQDILLDELFLHFFLEVRLANGKD